MRIPNYLSADVVGGQSGPRWRMLSNRWRVNINVSSGEARNVCARVHGAIGLSKDEWHIEEIENGNGK